MSFSSDVKSEISVIEDASACCSHAMCYAMLLFGKSFSSKSITSLFEKQITAEKFASLIEAEVGFSPDIIRTEGKKYKVIINDPLRIQKIYDAFSFSKSDIKKRINMGNLQNLSQDDEIYNCCFRAFIRGAFLSCGTVSDPLKSYHLEFVVPYKQLSMDFQRLLKDCDIYAKIANRRGVCVLYIKDSSQIENILNIIGATRAELKLIDIKVQKSVKNKVNRSNNFEYANISRTASAAAEHFLLIDKIRENKTFDLLPDDLKKLVELRRENPDASLMALGEMFEPKISRSAVNYKFKRLKDFSKKSKNQLAEELAENQ